jgi:hypothetical protein
MKQSRPVLDIPWRLSRSFALPAPLPWHVIGRASLLTSRISAASFRTNLRFEMKPPGFAKLGGKNRLRWETTLKNFVLALILDKKTDAYASFYLTRLISYYYQFESKRNRAFPRHDGITSNGSFRSKGSD